MNEVVTFDQTKAKDLESKPGLIFQKIPEIMAEIEAIGKNRRNVKQDFQFRGIDDVYNELNKLMAKHKVFTSPKIVNRQSKERMSANGKVLIERILTIRYRFYAEDGSYFDSEVDGEAMDTGDKSTNKCMSVAHKYALIQVFCIHTEDTKGHKNDDPDHHSPDPYVKPKEQEYPIKPKTGIVSSESKTILLVTAKQLVRLDRIREACRLTYDQVNHYVWDKFKTHTDKISRAQYDQLCRAMEAGELNSSEDHFQNYKYEDFKQT